MTRQRELFLRDQPPEYVAVINESVLDRQLGGGEVLRDQLNRLLDYAREPHISIVVLPTAADIQLGVSNGFVILEFADSDDPAIVFHDRPGSDVAADSADEVDRYRTTFDQMIALGRSGTDAISMIQRARDKLAPRTT
jgi:hypothetical protein